jgi:hypothetical protein
MSKSSDEIDAMMRHLLAREYHIALWRMMALTERMILAGWRPKVAEQGDRT